MTTTVEYPATRKQKDFILALLDQKQLELRPMDQFDDVKVVVDGLSKHMASRWITRLKELPDKHPSLQTQRKQIGTITSDVPAGRYAVTGEDGTTDFYRVDRPTEGRWAGYIFVKLLLGGPHGRPREERVPLRNIQVILNKIEEAGPEQASKRYGMELGVCGVCGRTLTNNESIERGIGPVCAAKNGWGF